MPTFNQLVRKGRQQATYKSTAPALQKGLNTLKNQDHRPVFSPEERCLHRRQNHHPQEAELRSAEDRPCASDQRL